LLSVIIIHEVEDVGRWLASSVKAEMAAKYGLTFREYVDAAGSKLVGAYLEVPNIDFILKFFNSPENKAAMKIDGIRPETLRLLIAPQAL
jgi:hypothetical protein